MGGKNPFLGIAYIVVGGICIVLGAVFTGMHFIKPRYVSISFTALFFYKKKLTTFWYLRLELERRGRRGRRWGCRTLLLLLLPRHVVSSSFLFPYLYMHPSSVLHLLPSTPFYIYSSPVVNLLFPHASPFPLLALPLSPSRNRQLTMQSLDRLPHDMPSIPFRHAIHSLLTLIPFLTYNPLP